MEDIWKTPSYTLEEANGIRISGLRYVDQDPYTRILYVMVAQNDLEPLQIDLKTIDLPDWAESLAWAMPREVLYRVLPTVLKHRALENRRYDEDTIYAFLMPVDNGRDDILALGIKNNGKILENHSCGISSFANPDSFTIRARVIQNSKLIMYC